MPGSELHGRVHRRSQVSRIRRVGLNQQNRAVRTSRRHHVHIDGGLHGPALGWILVTHRIRWWVVRSANLIDLLETTGRRTARWQAVARPVSGEIALGVGVVVSSHNGHGLTEALSRGRKTVGAFDVGKGPPPGRRKWTVPGSPEARLLESGSVAGDLLSVVGSFELSRRDVTDGFEESAMVEPVDPLEGGVLDVVDALPRTTPADELGLVEPDDRLGERVDAPIGVKPAWGQRACAGGVASSTPRSPEPRTSSGSG